MPSPALQQKLQELLLAANGPNASAMGNTPQQPMVTGYENEAPQSVQPAMSMSRMSSSGSDMTEERLKKLLRERIMQSEEEQKQGIDLQKMQLAGRLSQKQPLDLSGGYAVARMLGASDAGKGYQPPDDMSKGDQESMNALAKQRQALTDDQINQLKDQLRNKIMNSAMDRNRIMEDRMDRNEHMKIVSALNTNKPLVERAAQYQNLSNALTLITKPKNLTPQQIHEFQQAVRKNIGISGTSGVGEREATYFNSIGLNGESWTQFLTGDPATISKNSKLMHHLKDLANTEMDNVQAQYGDTLDAVSEGRASMYMRRPDLKSDLDRKILSMGKRVGIGKGANDTASATLNKAGGHLPEGGATSNAYAKPAMMSEDEFIKKFLEAKKAANGK